MRALAIVTLAVGIGACASPAPSEPAATPGATPGATVAVAGMLHLTTDAAYDHHDAVQIRYLLADGRIAGGSDVFEAETTIFLDRSLPAGPVRIFRNDTECVGTVTIEANLEVDAVLSVDNDVCTVAAAAPHALRAILHPEPYTGIGAFVVVDSVLVVRPLDPGNAIEPIRKPADASAEVVDFAVPPGRYALDLEVAGVVLKTLEIDLKRGQAFYFDVRALDPDVPVDCGDVPAAACAAAAEEAYAAPQGNGTPATVHVTSVRVRPSRYVGGCQPFEPPLYDVTFEFREEPGSVEVTLGGRPDGRLYYCTY